MRLKKNVKIALGFIAITAGTLTIRNIIKDYQEKEYQRKRELAYQELYDSMSVVFNPAYQTIEYGSDYDQSKLVQSSTHDVVTIHSIDPNAVNTYELTYVCTDITEYEDTVSKQFQVSVTVEDTQFPVIALYEPSVEIMEGNTYDLFANIQYINDPVDGDLPYSDTLVNHSYTLTSNANFDIPGTYTITITAMDKNGNTTSADYTIQVNEKPATPNELATGSSPYYIRINRVYNTVTVYTKDDYGYYSVPYTAFICSTGSATPTGTYTTYNKSRWRYLFGGVYGQYVTDIVGDILFHSVPYSYMDPSTLEYWEYNKLGTSASMGCIRLEVKNTLWIYNNCPLGTIVEIYDDWNDPGPFGIPSFTYIDENDSRRGWDPTDPDTSNPWNY